MSFPVFKDLSKTPTEIIKDDYDLSYSIKVKAKAPRGVTLTQTTEANFGGGKSSLGGKVSAKWAHPSGFSLDKFEVKSSGNVVVETSLADLSPGLKLEFKGDDANKGDLGAVFKNQKLTATAELDIAQFSGVSGSVVTGSGPYTGGVSAALSLGDKFELKSLDLFGSYSVPKNLFAGLLVSNHFSKYSVSLAYLAGKNYTVSGLVDYASEKAVTNVSVGGAYKCNPDTSLKAKFNSNGTLSFSVKQLLSDDCSVTAVAEVPSKDLSAFKLGLTASLG